MRYRPMYLFDKATMVHNVTELRAAFDKVGIRDVVLAYSIKTNPHPMVIATAKELGMYAEVVSHNELELAFAARYGSESIVYNGVIPDTYCKFAIASHGGIVNVDSYEELAEIEEIAASCHTEIEVGVRVNLDVHNGIKSRFGIVYKSEEWEKAMKLAEESPYLKISGIHSHIYKGRQIETWELRSMEAAIIAKKIGARYIDLGSNMYGPMDERLSVQFGDSIPSFDDYAKTIRNSLLTVYKTYDKFPSIILEPGTPVVANAVSVVARVNRIREVWGREIAVADCSKYDFGFATVSHNVPVDVIHRSPGEEHEDLVICGYTCIEDDILHSNYSGRLARGDILVFRNLGAYSLSVSSRFIMPPLPFIGINGKTEKEFLEELEM